jgi:hypothetical protein
MGVGVAAQRKHVPLRERDGPLPNVRVFNPLYLLDFLQGGQEGHPLSVLAPFGPLAPLTTQHGTTAVALTEATAAIQSSTGTISAITTYRRHNKPALEPVGDCLDDLEPPIGGAGRR